MSVIIKTEEEIQKMRVAGRLAGEVLQMIRPHVKAGVSTGELDRICHDYIVNTQKAIPAHAARHPNEVQRSQNMPKSRAQELART